VQRFVRNSTTAITGRPGMRLQLRIISHYCAIYFGYLV
jgi:hypothetical protein